MKATHSSSKKFLSNLSSKDKVAVICDNDLDGYSSGIIFYLFAKKQGAKVKSFIIDASKSQEGIMKQLAKFNKIIITDLPSNKITGILSVVKNKNVFYTDHHPADSQVSDNILEYRTINQGYVPSSRTAQELTEIELWRGLAGTMADMGHKYKENDEYIKKSLKELKMTQKKFLENVVFPLNKIIIYFHNNPKKAFNILSKIMDYAQARSLSRYTKPVEREIQKYIGMYKDKKEKLGKANFFLFNPKYPVKSTVTTVISLKDSKQIFIFANPDQSKIKISARSQSDIIDMGKLLREATKDFKNSKAGGHARAAGAIFIKKDLKKFKKRITELTNEI